MSSIIKPSSVVNSYKLESGKLVAVGEPIGSGFLQEPGDIIVDDDALYVSDFGKGQILKFSYRTMANHRLNFSLYWKTQMAFASVPMGISTLRKPTRHVVACSLEKAT